MPILFSRTATIPAWLVVVGLFAFSTSPMTFATSALLLLAGGMALTIVLVRWRERRPAIVATTMPGPLLTPLPAVDFLPNSWPNSGFRNTRQRVARIR